MTKKEAKKEIEKRLSHAKTHIRVKKDKRCSVSLSADTKHSRGRWMQSNMSIMWIQSSLCSQDGYN